MNIGKMILQLRRQQNITQEELAAELGVTAAAVSKWENGYTLPDILMLCALADYFSASTDELLGRVSYYGQAIVVADNHTLGEKIRTMIAKSGIETHSIYDNIPDAIASLKSTNEITHLLIGLHGCNHLDMHFNIQSNTLSLSPEISFDLGSKIVNLPGNERCDLDHRRIKLYISIANNDLDILNELRDATKNA